LRSREQGEEDEELGRREPPLSSAPMPRIDPSDRAPSSASLRRDDLRRLQATLYELSECRRLLTAALDENS
jgi:hypothetical protein